MTAAMTIAASRAIPNESTSIALSVSSDDAQMIPASIRRMTRKPTAAITGSFSAATMGGRSAFRTPITTATASAPRKLLTLIPGRIHAVTSTARPVVIQLTTNRTGLNFGVSGVQVGRSP